MTYIKREGMKEIRKGERELKKAVCSLAKVKDCTDVLLTVLLKPMSI